MNLVNGHTFVSMDQVLPCQQSYSTFFLSWAGESILSPIINRKSTLLTGTLSACLGCGRSFNWFNSCQGLMNFLSQVNLLMIITSFIGSGCLLFFHLIVFLPTRDQIIHLFYYMKRPPPQAFLRVNEEHGTRREKLERQMIGMSAEQSPFLS